MPYSNSLFNNFAGGEGSDKMVSRSDLPVHKSILERVENWIALPQGPLMFRPGTSFVYHTRLNQPAVFIPFQFNDAQAYLIEVTDQRFRFYKDGGIIIEADTTISDITQSNPGVVTDVAHGYSDGDEVVISGVEGMVQVNGGSYIVTNSTTDTFELFDVFGDPVDTTGYDAYISDGVANRIYEIVTPYLEADLEQLQYTQNADVMYIVHRGYAPRKLTRLGETNWTLATFVRAADPFTGAGAFPGSATFTDDGRLIYGGTTNQPETLFASRGPATNGASRFDDMTTGTAASDGVRFTLAPIHGKVDSIRWLSNTDKFIVAGTFGTVRRVFGATEAQPITPTSITVKSVNAYGVQKTLPVAKGPTLMYIQRGGQIIRSIEYDYQIDGYDSVDRNLIADHITQEGVKMIVNQAGNPEIMWAVTDTGKVLGLTYNDKENKFGWHRHNIGRGDVEWLGILPRLDEREQLWMIVNRTINGNTVRMVEYMTDPIEYPMPIDFYTSPDSDEEEDLQFANPNEALDLARYGNALYEAQKDYVNIDASIQYDGSAFGLAGDISLDPDSAAVFVGSDFILFETDAPFFTLDMVGRQLWKKYAADGTGGGRARIQNVVSSTQAQCEILKAFDDADEIPPGSWFLTALSLSGIRHLEGEEVVVVADGALFPRQTVTDGSITLPRNASKVTIGLPYTGIIKTYPLDFGGVLGPAQSKPKNVSQLAIRFTNSIGVKYGTDLYRLAKMDFRSTADISDRPIPPFTGVKKQFYSDGWQDDKNVFVVQNVPFPAIVNSLDVYADVADEP